MMLLLTLLVVSIVKNAKQVPNNCPIKKEPLKRLDFFMSIINTSSRDLRMCGSVFHHVKEKYRSSSTRLVAGSSLSCNDARNLSSSETCVVVKFVVVAFDVNLSDPDVIFSYEDSLWPVLDVSLANCTNNDRDLIARPQVIPCNAISAHRDVPIETTMGVTPIAVSTMVALPLQAVSLLKSGSMSLMPDDSSEQLISEEKQCQRDSDIDA